jgi:deoxyribodipyrimidine photo-lyase
MHRAFKPDTEALRWNDPGEHFEAWKEGRTGIPIVDAGMRQLRETGWMHNRLRMITAMFLSKNLFIDWRLGEAWFMQNLVDGFLASNNGGWQWSASTGTDAAPYFRVFNPYSQQKKFDKDFKYIKKWVPEFGTDRYPEPMVDHKMARERCLEAYKSGLDRAEDEA